MLNLELWQTVIDTCVAKGLNEAGVIRLLEVPNLTIAQFELTVDAMIKVKL